MFSTKTSVRVAYASRGMNVSLPVEQVQMRPVALIGGISSERGLEHYSIFENSVNSDKFIEFLNGLADKLAGSKAVLFMDNLRVHHAKRVKEHMEKLGIAVIFNTPYSPENNPIELF